MLRPILIAALALSLAGCDNREQATVRDDRFAQREAQTLKALKGNVETVLCGRGDLKERVFLLAHIAEPSRPYDEDMSIGDEITDIGDAVAAKGCDIGADQAVKDDGGSLRRSAKKQ